MGRVALQLWLFLLLGVHFTCAKLAPPLHQKTSKIFVTKILKFVNSLNQSYVHFQMEGY